MPRLIYLASPYSHDDHAVRTNRYRSALAVTRWLFAAGAHVFSPIVYSHFLVSQTTGAASLPASWAFWRGFDLSMLGKCDVLAVLTLPGWERSVGVQAEIAGANAGGVLIYYLSTLDDLKKLVAFAKG